MRLALRSLWSGSTSTMLFIQLSQSDEIILLYHVANVHAALLEQGLEILDTPRFESSSHDATTSGEAVAVKPVVLEFLARVSLDSFDGSCGITRSPFVHTLLMVAVHHAADQAAAVVDWFAINIYC